ncbi:MAG: thioredoxin family protein [Bacteroidia bacterium]
MKNVMAFSLIVLLFLGKTVLGQGYEVGDVVADFNLKGVDHKMYSLEGMANVDGVILTFTCNTCPVSQAYEQRILELDAKYKDQGYPVVAINPNDESRQPGDSFAAMLDRAENKGYTFPYLQDATQEIAKAYGATRTPHNFVLQKNDEGAFVVKYIGAIDNNMQSADAATEKYLENAVDQLIAGEEVSVPFTKAIGCGIKWAN